MRFHVRSEALREHADLLGTPAREHVSGEVLAEEGQGLRESIPSVFLVSLGPEEGENGISAMQPARSSDGQVCKEGESLRLGEDGRDFLP